MLIQVRLAAISYEQNVQRKARHLPCFFVLKLFYIMATFNFGSAQTAQMLQQSGLLTFSDGADFAESAADPTKNIVLANITTTYLNPIPIYRGFLSGVEFVSTTIPDGASNIVILGYTNKPI